MKITANTAIYPSLVITNDDICSQIQAHTGLHGSAMSTVLSEVRRYLARLGAQRRRWLAASERPIDIIAHAYEIALERAEIAPATIDSIIYCGVDRALLEPANAALLASELHLTHARAFDVVHACQGWFTALQIAGDRADTHAETSLIIAAEFPMTYGGVTRPTNFDLSNFERDKWKLATFVLGEGASATIVAPGGGSLRYEQRNDSAGYRASYVRLPQTERFIARSRPLFDAPEMTFYSDPSRLLTHGVSLGFEVFDSLQRGNLEDVVVIPHTISTRLLRFLKARYGDDLPVVDLFPDFGNLGTVSLSAGLAWLERERMCHKGAWPGRPVGWMLSAGMSAVAFEFPN